jgi:hypothetical protein
MHEKHLFEYAIIRVVPRVEREEFLNVGVILYCAAENFLQVKFEVNQTKLAAFVCEVETEELKKRLIAFEQICKGEESGVRLLSCPSLKDFVGLLLCAALLCKLLRYTLVCVPMQMKHSKVYSMSL